MDASQKISFIIPTFKREKFLENCLRSLFRQTHPPDQIIVVDDDNLCWGEFITNLISEKPKETELVYCRKDEQYKKGQAVSRNMGVAMATGDLIGFADDDVWFDPDYVEEVVKIFRNDTAGAIAGVFGQEIGVDTKYHKKYSFFQRLKAFLKYDFFLLGLYDLSTIYAHPLIKPGKVYPWLAHYPMFNKDGKEKDAEWCNDTGSNYRRWIFDEFKQDENLTKLDPYSIGEDLDFSYRITRKYRLRYSPKIKLRHFSHGGSVGKKIFYGKADIIIYKYFYLFKKLIKQTFLNNFLFYWANLSLLFYLVCSVRFFSDREYFSEIKKAIKSILETLFRQEYVLNKLK